MLTPLRVLTLLRPEQKKVFLKFFFPPPSPFGGRSGHTQEEREKRRRKNEKDCSPSLTSFPWWERRVGRKGGKGKEEGLWSDGQTRSFLFPSSSISEEEKIGGTKVRRRPHSKSSEGLGRGREEGLDVCHAEISDVGRQGRGKRKEEEEKFFPEPISFFLLWLLSLGVPCLGTKNRCRSISSTTFVLVVHPLGNS